jgi:hypothetical protein
MACWEYRFIDLFHRPEYLEREPPVVRAMHLVTDELDAAGRDGWEAVGQVTIAAGGLQHPVILLKRPLPDDR